MQLRARLLNDSPVFRGGERAGPAHELAQSSDEKEACVCVSNDKSWLI